MALPLDVHGKAVIARAILPSSFGALSPAARDFRAAMHIQVLEFGDVSEPSLEFAEETAA